MKPSPKLIPDPLWEEMIHFYGYEKTYKIAENHLNSFHLLTIKLVFDKFKKRFGF